MAGIFDFGDLGLNHVDGSGMFDTPEKKSSVPVRQVKAEAPVITEKDLIYDKSIPCPVCDRPFVAKIMKTGKAKSLGNDPDLRPIYEAIDAGKYDVCLCPNCGYSALGRYFSAIVPAQAKLIKENITGQLKLTKYPDSDTYSYPQVLERYKVALACAVVKRAKNSEKAFICLKTAWVLRGYREELVKANATTPDPASLEVQEEEYLKNAYTGFLEALKSEGFPMCGMDELTMDYLLAQLAFRQKMYNDSAKLVAAILTSKAPNQRIKDKARDLKEELLKIKGSN